jgi:hypothetical protein
MLSGCARQDDKLGKNKKALPKFGWGEAFGWVDNDNNYNYRIFL